MEESQRVSVADAAKEIGCNVEYLRRQMKAGNWELGRVVKPSGQIRNYQYFIFRPLLDRFMGMGGA